MHAYQSAFVNVYMYDTNIISTPSIVTTDNEEASLNVGQEVPFVTGSFSNTGGTGGAVNPFQTIQREQVGVSLTITPQINEGDSILLKIAQEISNISASATGAFTAFEYTATAAQTSFSGNDDNSSSLSYTAGVNNVLVSVNGVLLDGSDYTATNGTAVVLSVAAAANDMIKIQATNSSSSTSTDLNGSELVLDTDGDTTIAADTDDTIDIKISGADDFRFTANTLTALSGSSIVVPAGGLTIGSTAVARIARIDILIRRQLSASQALDQSKRTY